AAAQRGRRGARRATAPPHLGPGGGAPRLRPHLDRLTFPLASELRHAHAGGGGGGVRLVPRGDRTAARDEGRDVRVSPRRRHPRGRRGRALPRWGRSGRREEPPVRSVAAPPLPRARPRERRRLLLPQAARGHRAARGSALRPSPRSPRLTMPRPKLVHVTTVDLSLR